MVTATERNLVPRHLSIPIAALAEIKDQPTKSFLQILHRTIDNLLLTLSSVINGKMTNRYGDTFYGAMGFSSGGTFTIPVFAVDPTVLNDGLVWLNSTSGQIKVRIAGATKVFTVT